MTQMRRKRTPRPPPLEGIERSLWRLEVPRVEPSVKPVGSGISATASSRSNGAAKSPARLVAMVKAPLHV
jgi:hypothetical protein